MTWKIESVNHKITLDWKEGAYFNIHVDDSTDIVSMVIGDHHNGYYCDGNSVVLLNMPTDQLMRIFNNFQSSLFYKQVLIHQQTKSVVHCGKIIVFRPGKNFTSWKRGK